MFTLWKFERKCILILGYRRILDLRGGWAEDALLKTGRLSKNLPTKWRVPQPLSLLAFKTRVTRIVAQGQKMRIFFGKNLKDSQKSFIDPDLLEPPIQRPAYHLIPLKQSLPLVQLLM